MQADRAAARARTARVRRPTVDHRSRLVTGCSDCRGTRRRSRRHPAATAGPRRLRSSPRGLRDRGGAVAQLPPDRTSSGCGADRVPDVTDPRQFGGSTPPKRWSKRPWPCGWRHC